MLQKGNDIKLKQIIKDDLYRYYGFCDIKSFIKAYFKLPGFKYMLWFRVTSHIKANRKFFYPLFWSKLRRLQFKYGYDIPAGSLIANGFYIGHFGGIVISPKAIVGKNCNISQNVTIGVSSRGSRKGYPTIGDNVYIGPGAKIIGNIRVGNNVAIGANAVVCNDVPDNAVVVGIPAKVISFKGSEGYILNKIQ
jgi:serine O-acetyltransferase